LYTAAQVYDSKPDGDNTIHSYVIQILSSNKPDANSGSTGCPIDPSQTGAISGLVGMFAVTGQDDYF